MRRIAALFVVFAVFIGCAPSVLETPADEAPAVDASADAAETPDAIVAVEASTDASAPPADVAADANTCGAHAERIGAACRCVTGYTACDGRCVDLFNDGANCSACGRLCEGGVCALGRCVSVAPPVDAGSDAGDAAACASMTPGNCCGVACPTHPTASAATCEAGRCGLVCASIDGVPVYGNCDGNAANGCEVDLRVSAANCGACGAPCAPHRSCRARACSTACDPGWTDCDGNAANGCETNTASDAANCRTCGNACGAGMMCVGGTCSR
jgi:hypothetical protein